ncbi:TetR family transcriptional regulator [Streptomyces sp. NPDC020379]|uniref:TetR family transcriptional regulator n=1 Tax=Streptomyces sp. NPDC020379 TaxID=3365071 RepID=UPI0037AA72BD
METSQRDDQQRAAERRRKELLEAADRVVLRDGPGASMNAIAAEAGITKPILYRHFGDKGGLYRALATRHTEALLAGLRAALDAPAATRRDRVEATLDTYLVAIETRPQVYRFLMHPADEGHSPSDQGEQGFDVGRHSAPLLRRLGEELAQVIAERVDLGPGSDELARAWGHGIVGMMHAAGDWWLRERPFPRENLVRHLADLLWGRLAAAGDLEGGPAF